MPIIKFVFRGWTLEKYGNFACHLKLYLQFRFVVFLEDLDIQLSVDEPKNTEILGS